MREQVYHRLRGLGLSIGTADELAPVIAQLSPRRREAAFLLIGGYTYREIESDFGISCDTVRFAKKEIKIAFGIGAN